MTVPSADGADRLMRIIARMVGIKACLIGMFVTFVVTGGLLRVMIIAFLLFVAQDLLGPLLDIFKRQGGTR